MVGAGKTPVIIGLTAYAGSGKSTAAKRLNEHGMQTDKFAAPLKSATRAVFRAAGFADDFIEEMVEGKHKEESFVQLSGATPRQVMQWLGHSAQSEIDPYFWVNMLVSRVVNAPPVSLVIDDVRYAHEAAAIRGLGGYIIAINRDGVGPVNGHPSENVVDHDILIQNDGTLDEFLADVDEAMSLISYWTAEKKGRAA